MTGKMLPSFGYWQEWIRAEGWEWRTVSFVCLFWNTNFKGCRHLITQFREMFLRIPMIVLFIHTCPLFHGCCDKRSAPQAARTYLQSPVSRSECDNTVNGLLVLVNNRWSLADVNSHFTMTVVHSSCLRILERTLHYVALKSCFPG